MFLTKEERQEVLEAYGHPEFIHDTHYQAEPDVWVYLYYDGNGKKYVLFSADYMGDFDFDHFPQLLKKDGFPSLEKDMVLQRELSPKDLRAASNTALFEYTD